MGRPAQGLWGSSGAHTWALHMPPLHTCRLCIHRSNQPTQIKIIQKIIVSVLNKHRLLSRHGSLNRDSIARYKAHTLQGGFKSQEDVCSSYANPTPYYIRASSICRFWYLRKFWNTGHGHHGPPYSQGFLPPIATCRPMAVPTEDGSSHSG